MLEELNNFDWEEVFKYAQPKICEAGHNHGPVSASFNQSISTEAFTREDVAQIYAMQDGENDGPDWVGVFQLKDGRVACIRAGCDYTGWG